MRDHLNGLDTSKARGPDSIPARLLKQCSEQIAPSLCGIFNNSLSSGRIPREWKPADIIPIHKKESKDPAPSQISLKTEIEGVQRRVMRWILQTRVGEMSYKDRLLALNLLPLTFDRKLKDMFFSTNV